MLVAHAFGGCDTISSPAGYEKVTLLKRLSSGELKSSVLDIFLNPDSNAEQVVEAGQQIFHLLDAGDTDLSTVRYNQFAQQTLNGSIKPELLGLKNGAAGVHTPKGSFFKPRIGSFCDP